MIVSAVLFGTRPSAKPFMSFNCPKNPVIRVKGETEAQSGENAGLCSLKAVRLGFEPVCLQPQPLAETPHCIQASVCSWHLASSPAQLWEVSQGSWLQARPLVDPQQRAGGGAGVQAAVVLISVSRIPGPAPLRSIRPSHALAHVLTTLDPTPPRGLPITAESRSDATYPIPSNRASNGRLPGPRSLGNQPQVPR